MRVVFSGIPWVIGMLDKWNNGHRVPAQIRTKEEIGTASEFRNRFCLHMFLNAGSVPIMV
jgi:hypothetical protein